MYRVTVTTRVLNDKDTLRLSAPILIWLVLFIIIFGVMCIADIWFLVLPMFLEFLCIIPVTVWSIKKARKLRQESFVKIDVMLTARDGMIYKDNMKLNVTYSEQDNEVYLVICTMRESITIVKLLSLRQSAEMMSGDLLNFVVKIMFRLKYFLNDK